MRGNELNLDCSQDADGTWRVYCINSKRVLARGKRDPEHAWAVAADVLASRLSYIKLVIQQIGD